MDHYNYPKRLKAIWTAAVAKYKTGHKTPEGFLDDDTIAELATLGLNPVSYTHLTLPTNREV